MLLSIAVILPTVCLLWFMGQAVKNERLAVRQKLIDVYEKKANEFSELLDSRWQDNIRVFSAQNHLTPSQFFLVFAELNATRHYGGLILYDSEGKRTYPIYGEETSDIPESNDNFDEAWRLEFVEKDFAEAVKIYEAIAVSSKKDTTRYSAMMGNIRCLKKLGEGDEAAKICSGLAYPGKLDYENNQLVTLVQRARVMLAEILSEAKDEQLLNQLRKLFGDSHYTPCPSEARIWTLQKLIDITEDAGLSNQLNYEIKGAQLAIRAEQFSLLPMELFPNAAALDGWQEGTIRKLDLPTPVYGIHFRFLDKKVLCLMRQNRLFSYLRPYIDDVTDQAVFCEIYDNFGDVVLGENETVGEPFFVSSLAKYLPEWKVEFYFKDADVFENAAKKQTAIYIWTGVLVIVLVVIVGSVAGQAVGRQIKLNKLKNDFIATVSHELKTPLSSIRVLVDTLLEDNYNNKQQAIEYLQLVSKENQRLSRMIDNFLTFSRMERNKQVFDMVSTSPAEIVENAAEAMQTKFNSNCQFEIDIDDNLPQISADKDAIVTVLVNLLDNAYKYSNGDKIIKLNVFKKEGNVCFSVVDNGIGMPRRTVKKIFSRFYQVDQSLSRNAEGCGLGLSIVKFIIDAHKGTIDVESTPGEGSTFTVKLSTVQRKMENT